MSKKVGWSGVTPNARQVGPDSTTPSKQSLCLLWPTLIPSQTRYERRWVQIRFRAHNWPILFAGSVVIVSVQEIAKRVKSDSGVFSPYLRQPDFQGSTLLSFSACTPAGGPIQMMFTHGQGCSLASDAPEKIPKADRFFISCFVARDFSLIVCRTELGSERRSCLAIFSSYLAVLFASNVATGYSV